MTNKKLTKADVASLMDAGLIETMELLKSLDKKIPEACHLVTHQANLVRFTNNFGKDLMVSAGRCYAWHKTHWVATEVDLWAKACLVSRIINDEIKMWQARKPKDDNEKEKFNNIIAALQKWAPQSEMKGAISAVVELSKKLLAIDEDELDKDPWALNCQNGTVDLRTGKLKPHEQSDLITKICPVPYNPDAKCPIFESVIARVAQEEDRETKPTVNFLQRWFGYCASASVREQKLVVHHGTGRNGKSTILDIIATVLGDYASTAPPGLLVSSGRDRHPSEIADLFGRRMVTAHETADGNMLREDFVKQATGGDKLKARFMGKDFFEFSPTHKLQLLTNHKPTIRGQDKAIWCRVLLVPYYASFGTPEEVASGFMKYVKNEKIYDDLLKEKEGILRWVIDGAVKWYLDGLQPPDVILAASKDYQTEQDRVMQFCSEECQIDPNYEGKLNGEKDSIYAIYCQWCEDSGFKALGKLKFKEELERIVPDFKTKSKQVEVNGRKKDRLFAFGIRITGGEPRF